MEDMEEEDNIIEVKAILIGGHFVGKTSLINVTIGIQFDSDLKPTITSSYVEKKFIINQKKYLVKLWDTAGMEKFRTLNKLFYKDSQIVIFVYDITRKESFEELNFWTNEIRKELGENLVLGMAGNKIDLVDSEQVDESMARDYAQNINANFKLVSAKENPRIFISFLEELLNKYIGKNNNNDRITNKKGENIKINLNNNKNIRKSNGCC
jgi:small GTP-binding protein